MREDDSDSSTSLDNFGSFVFDENFNASLRFNNSYVDSKQYKKEFKQFLLQKKNESSLC
jgi:hypothetical protein